MTIVSCRMQYLFFVAIYLACNQAFGKTEYYGFLNLKKVKRHNFWQSNEMKTEDFPKFPTCEDLD